MNEPRAYYNEVDPYAAQWLRNLIAAGHIAPGDVDERSIEDVQPADLVGYTQCHFFAGIGIWSYALRRAGWPDHRPVWTGSCPCQPFSTAGQGKGVADERHLWPAWFHLIERAKGHDVPVFGEQVANGDGLAWLDIVWADMEGAGYAFRPVDLCSAGFGSPNIRQRLYFHASRDLANSNVSGQPGPRVMGRPGNSAQSENWKVDRTIDDGGHVRMADTGHGEHIGRDPVRGTDGEPDRAPGTDEGSGEGGDVQARERSCNDTAVRGTGSGVADANFFSGDGDGRTGGRGEHSDSGILGRLADGPGIGRGEQRTDVSGSGSGSDTQGMGERLGGGCVLGTERPGPTNGHWRTVDWLFCRDRKWRAVEPGTFPLASGAPSRVGRLRAYGNGLNAEAAQEFISAVLADEIVATL